MAVAPRCSGTLTLTVHECKELTNKDVGKQDPFVKVKLGDHSFKTKTHKKAGENPKFKETFKFTLHDYDLKEKLQVEAWDEDALSNDKIGRTEIHLDTLIKEAHQDDGHWYQLLAWDDHRQICGAIRLSVVAEGKGFPGKSEPAKSEYPVAELAKKKLEEKLHAEHEKEAARKKHEEEEAQKKHEEEEARKKHEEEEKHKRQFEELAKKKHEQEKYEEEKSKKGHHLKTHHGTFLQARGGESTKVTTSTNSEAWETFQVVPAEGGKVTLKNAAHNAYISARDDGSVTMMTKPQEWEHFHVVKHSNGKVSFKTWRNTYLRAEPGNGAKVDQAKEIQDWEMFHLA